MTSLKGTKINQILKVWPSGSVAVSSWLESQGVYPQLANDYEKNAWIKRVGHGAYVKDGDFVEWQGGLYAIQDHLHLPIHAAAKTALELQGVVHFVPAANSTIYLFGAPGSRLPDWFKKYNWKAKIYFTRTNLFSKNLGLTEKNFGSYSIQTSSRERAVLELLHLIPHEQSFEEARLLFEGLRTLRPKLLQALLENCTSVKAKRLFLHFADSTNQEWFKEINLRKIKLGSGKRVVAKGGVFDTKYDISVPKSPKEDQIEGA